MDQANPRDIAAAADLLVTRSRILVFTGAGISTESGIPDFRGPNGVWKTQDPKLFTLQNWLADEDFRKQRWERRFTESRPNYRPNPAHVAVARLWNSGKMIGCVTQNIDGLHQAGGLPKAAVAELHGNASGLACWERGHPADLDETALRWAEGELDPRCTRCGSILKSTVTMFGETLPEHEVELAQAWTDDADAVIVVGSTLSVYPAAYFPLEVASRGEPAIIINQGPTEHDGIASVLIDANAGAALPDLVDRIDR